MKSGVAGSAVTSEHADHGMTASEHIAHMAKAGDVHAGHAMDEVAWAAARAQATPLVTAIDHYLVAAEHIARGRFQQAQPLLATATEQDPQDFWAWFLQGVCHDNLAQGSDAVASYNTCVALSPSSPWAYLNRGLAHLRQQQMPRVAAALLRRQIHGFIVIVGRHGVDLLSDTLVLLE